LKHLGSAAAGAFYNLMIQNQLKIDDSQPVIIGKYRIAACSKPLHTGRFAAQVSIASGRGSATTDRVISFHNDFSTPAAAASFAIAQGIDWVHSATCPQ
jgi:hypothetical protein